VRVLQEGVRAWPAGVASALAFMLRPQSAMFFVMVFAAVAGQLSPAAVGALAAAASGSGRR
jgi:hypothetical protein